MDTEAGEYGVQFEELLQRLDSGKIKLIDVREPSEVEETGSMPASINIPSNIALLFPASYRAGLSFHNTDLRF